MSVPLIIAMLAAMGGAGGLSYLSSKREQELGMKQLGLQEKQMGMSAEADVRAMNERKAMAAEDRKAAREMRDMDLEYQRMGADKDRRLQEEALQMQLIQAILGSGSASMDRMQQNYASPAQMQKLY